MGGVSQGERGVYFGGGGIINGEGEVIAPDVGSKREHSCLLGSQVEVGLPKGLLAVVDSKSSHYENEQVSELHQIIEL